MYETEQNKERLLLIAITDTDAATHELNELAMLAETAGAEVVGEMIQNRVSPHPAHYFGKGKIEELKDYAISVNATGILCDDELTSSQIKNLDKALDCKLKILDRTMIILDIFAERALSSEGKAQVELAQLKYRLSRLMGLGTQLSRQGGHSAASGLGIGARGPGEKKLETDRRHIQNRIKSLNKELADIRTGRAILRERRLQTGIPVISLVGYTNAGKSTLMNTLTSANVPAEDKLFATLDTTVRKLRLPGGTKSLITDTVGFIEKLPHHLIQAFRATLEELKYSNILIHVVDASNPNSRDQILVVQDTLKDLQCLHKPTITAFNKQDIKISNISPGISENVINISAKTGLNTDKLLNYCENLIHQNLGVVESLENH